MGYQRPVSGNSNQFKQYEWDNPDMVEEFPDSPGLWCGDDLVIRAGMNIDHPRAKYSISLVPALRLSDDRILQGDNLVPVDGSCGFSLNVNAGLELKLGSYGYFHFLAALPVLQRETYPDGLDRIITVMAGFGIQFPD